MIDKKVASDAVRKYSSQLISHLSAGVVGLHDFGESLVASKFLTKSALSDILDNILASDKASKLSYIVCHQVQLHPEKYFKAYLSILRTFLPLNSLLESIIKCYGKRNTYKIVWQCYILHCIVCNNFQIA